MAGFVGSPPERTGRRNEVKERVRFYSVYERLWHWVQAIAGIVLIVTGFEISFPQYVFLTDYGQTVHIHNIFGFILVVNAALALFYNLAAGLLKRYLPDAADLFPMGFAHARYYLVGIFKGEPHPFEKTPEQRLLPLQKVTYFAILNVLLPLMAFTGLLKWSAEIDPNLVNHLGGLKLWGPIHRFGAWLFTAFLILHVYMTTTGHTPLSGIRSMITGYEDVDKGHEGD